MKTAAHGRWAFAKALLLHPEIDANAQDIRNRTAVAHAILNGNHKVLRFLLRNSRVDPNLGQRHDWTPLHVSVLRGGDAKSIDLLLSHPNIDVNSKTANGGETPLHIAAFHGRSAATRRLLQCPEIEMNAINHNGWTALDLAVHRNHSAVASLLRDHAKANGIGTTNGDRSITTRQTNVEKYVLVWACKRSFLSSREPAVFCFEEERLIYALHFNCTGVVE